MKGGLSSVYRQSQAREPFLSTSSAGMNLDPYNLPTAPRGKTSNSSAQDAATSQKPVQLPLMSQRLLNNELKQPSTLANQVSPPRSNSTAEGIPAGSIASGSTPSLYRPISSVHQSRKDLGLQAPSAAGVSGRVVTHSGVPNRVESRFLKSNLNSFT